MDYPRNDLGWPIFSKRSLEILRAVRDFGHRPVPVVMVDRLSKRRIQDAFFAVQLEDELTGALDREHSVLKMVPSDPTRTLRVKKWVLADRAEGRSSKQA